VSALVARHRRVSLVGSRLWRRHRVAFRLFSTTWPATPPGKSESARARQVPPIQGALGACLNRDPLGSVEELELETRVMRSPGLEVEVELAAPLALARSVGDEDLDHAILHHVGNAAPEVKEVS
jgi:hypothetical protein